MYHSDHVHHHLHSSAPGCTATHAQHTKGRTTCRLCTIFAVRPYSSTAIHQLEAIFPATFQLSALTGSSLAHEFLFVPHLPLPSQPHQEHGDPGFRMDNWCPHHEARLLPSREALALAPSSTHLLTKRWGSLPDRKSTTGFTRGKKRGQTRGEARPTAASILVMKVTMRGHSAEDPQSSAIFSRLC